MMWTVHARPSRKRRKAGRDVSADVPADVPGGMPDDVVAVADAPARWALVFGTLWLLRHRLWWEALVFALATTLLGIVARFADPLVPWGPVLGLGLVLLPRVWLMLDGPDMRRRRLERAGWRPLGTFAGETADEAVVRALVPETPVPDERVPEEPPAGSERTEPRREAAPASAYRGRGETFGLVPAMR